MGRAHVWAFHRGHACYADQDQAGVYSLWKYRDDGSSIYDKERPCPRCGDLSSKDGHDNCIANLSGVEFACCGHGVEDGYVKCNDGHVIRFGTQLNRNQIEELIEKHYGAK